MPPAPTLAILDFEGGAGPVAVRSSEVTIGRHSSDDIRVSDIRVSRHHARLVAKRGGGFEIHNLTAVRSEPNDQTITGVFAAQLFGAGAAGFCTTPCGPPAETEFRR